MAFAYHYKSSARLAFHYALLCSFHLCLAVSIRNLTSNPTIIPFTRPNMSAKPDYEAAVAFFKQHQGEPGMGLKNVAKKFPGVKKDSLSRRVGLKDAKRGPRPKIPSLRSPS